MRPMDTGTSPVVLGEAFVDARHETYADLRAQGAVHRAIMPDGLPVWIVTRYDEARAALTSPVLSKDSDRAAPLHDRSARERGARRDRLAQAINRHLLNLDPPEHTRLRRLVGKAFTMRRVELLRPRITEIADGLLDTLSPGEQVDLLASYASPLSLMVICEMLGFPRSEQGVFRQWSATIARGSDPQAAAQASFAVAELLADTVAAKRRTPDDGLLSALVRARDEQDRLDETEIVSMTFLLLSAGNETTAHFIGNAVVDLLTHPDQLAGLRSDPALLPGAVEELLRHQGPAATTTLRFTTAPLRLNEVEIPEGEFVIVAIESANRDERRFDTPGRLDVTRRATGHLAFGHGVHHCLGAPLARVEGQVALERLLSRFPRLTLAVPADQLSWRPGMLFRGHETVPVIPA
jgi:cytochrome P450